jgi:L-glyceraldehyde 3-phosphate reductase
MFERWVENGLLTVLEDEGIGCIPFSPLAQGLLSDKYLAGIPADSRAAKPHGFLQREAITDQVLGKIRALDTLAKERGQTLAQMAIVWLLKDRRITSVLVGASRVAPIEDNVASLNKMDFAPDELARIESILAS